MNNKKNMSIKTFFQNLFFEMVTLPHPPTKDSFQVVPIEFQTQWIFSGRVREGENDQNFKNTRVDYNSGDPGDPDPVSILFKKCAPAMEIHGFYTMSKLYKLYIWSKCSYPENLF